MSCRGLVTNRRCLNRCTTWTQWCTSPEHLFSGFQRAQQELISAVAKTSKSEYSLQFEAVLGAGRAELLDQMLRYW